MTTPQVCFFDIDGTLIRSGGAGRLAMEAALEEAFGIRATDHAVDFSGRTDRAIISDLLAFVGKPSGDEDVSAFVNTYLAHLPRTLREREGDVLPGIHELLGELADAANMHIGLLTGNVRDGARIKLTHYEIYEHFAFGGFGDVHKNRDDVARAAIDAAREHAGHSFAGQQVWVIGDSPHDITCARSVGARSIAVCTGWHAPEELAAHQPDVLLDDLSETAAVLDMLVGAAVD